MNKLPTAKQTAVLRALTEGVSIRSASRLAGVSKTTVLKLLVEVGELCATYQGFRLRNLPCKRIEADEVWAFVGKKQRRAKGPDEGDCWTYTAICADSKLLVSWLVGQKSVENAHIFMRDVAGRLANRVQLTTDGAQMYLTAVADAFKYDVDYAMLVKHYGKDPKVPEGRYSPPVCTGTEKKWVMGTPNHELVSTSYVERSNMSLRMANRRMTRLTNAFSRKVENHEHAFALFAMHYNFCRPHTTLTRAAGGVHTTPAMAAGLTDRVWKMEDVLGLMDQSQMVG